MAVRLSPMAQMAPCSRGTPCTDSATPRAAAPRQGPPLPAPGALLAHARALAQSSAAKSPLAMAGSKLAINYAVDHPTADALQQMTLLQSAIFDIDEMAKAIQAWKDKQPGSFDALAAVHPV